MKLRNREVEVRPNTRLEKKRRLEEQQDSRRDDADIKSPISPGVGGRKKSRPGPKKPPVQQRRKVSVREKKLLELLSDVSPPRSNPPLGAAGNENARPMPPEFRSMLQELRKSGRISKAVEKYLLNLRRGDSLRVPCEGGKSLLKDVLRDDAEEHDEGGSKGSEQWERGKHLGQGLFGIVRLWEKSRGKERPLQIATKDGIQDNTLFLDYNSEGNLVRRLNDLGCKNVIKVVDWFPFKERFRTCFEYAEYGDLMKLLLWYHRRNLIMPEAFVWHVFHGMANALCYCRHGTNLLHSRSTTTTTTRAPPGYDRIIHGDLNLTNILLAAPDQDCHQLYPCPKLADFGQSYTLGGPCLELQRWRNGWAVHSNMFLAPEVERAAPSNRRPRPGELQDSYSDVYSLGVVIALMCKKADRYLIEPIQDLLKRDRSANPSGRRIFSSYYSPPLKELTRRCRSLNPLERPPVYRLYLETKSGMEAFRDRAYQDAQDAPVVVVAGTSIDPNKVLYTAHEQELYDENMEFQEAYIQANLDPVMEAEGPEVWGTDEVQRKCDDILRTIDESIVTAIPKLPDSESSGRPTPPDSDFDSDSDPSGAEDSMPEI